MAKEKREAVIAVVVIAAVFLAGFVYGTYFNGECRMNSRMKLETIDFMKKPILDIENFCHRGMLMTQSGCEAKSFYIYTEAQDMPQEQRTWDYLEAQGNISGKVLWGALDNVCEWKTP